MKRALGPETFSSGVGLTRTGLSGPGIWRLRAKASRVMWERDGYSLLFGTCKYPLFVTKRGLMKTA